MTILIHFRGTKHVSRPLLDLVGELSLNYPQDILVLNRLVGALSNPVADEYTDIPANILCGPFREVYRRQLNLMLEEFYA